MSVRVDSSSWITGAVVVGDPGLGVKAELIPSTGENGSGYAYPSVVFPADAGKEICGRITNWPTKGVLNAFEDTSFEYVGASDTFAFQMYVDGVAVGSPQTVSITVGASSVVEARPVAQQSAITAPGLIQTHLTLARPVAQVNSANRPAISQAAVFNAKPVAQANAANAPGVTQAHIVRARATTQASIANRPGLSQVHIVAARAVIQAASVNAPTVDIGTVPSTVLQARPVIQFSTVNAPTLTQTHVAVARPVRSPSFTVSPSLVQTHIVRARHVVQSSTVRLRVVNAPILLPLSRSGSVTAGVRREFIMAPTRIAKV